MEPDLHDSAFRVRVSGTGRGQRWREADTELRWIADARGWHIDSLQLGKRKNGPDQVKKLSPPDLLYSERRRIFRDPPVGRLSWPTSNLGLP